MLLRTSSAPLINSVFPQPPDTPRDSSSSSSSSSSDLLPHHHHASSSPPSSFASLHPSSRHQRRPSADLHHILPPSSSDERLQRPLLSRAQSEGDLACFSAAMSAVADDIDAPFSAEATHGCKQWNRRLSLHRTASLEPGSSILEEAEKETDLDENPLSCKANPTADPTSAALGSFFLNDGELYTGLNVDTGGSPVACNAKGCRPLTDSECRKLGLLNLAGGVGSGNGNGLHSITADDGPDFSRNTDAYYQAMLRQNPSNPMLLRNYAQFLNDKGDLRKSEEYYERAILADPSDGEVLSQYAKLQWNVHKDKNRAEMYYDRAVEAAPDDCYVMASYASFLWDAEDNEDDISAVATPVPPHGGASALPSVLLAPA